jgi:hypothetical protein
MNGIDPMLSTYPTHIPLMHVAGAGHVTPHPPQFCAVLKGVHVPLHTPSPTGQHLLSTQLSPAGHMLPQAPHETADEVRSKQPGVPESAPQVVTGAPLSRPASVGHVTAHWPFTQTGFPGTLPVIEPLHDIWQVPQLSGSVSTSTHLPQQGTMVPVQGGVHMPQLQVLPEGHLMPHAPQFSGSVIVSELHVTSAPLPVSCVVAVSVVES